MEESDSVPTTQINNRTDFLQPLPEWVFAESKYGEMLALYIPLYLQETTFCLVTGI